MDQLQHILDPQYVYSRALALNLSLARWSLSFS